MLLKALTEKNHENLRVWLKQHKSTNLRKKLNSSYYDEDGLPENLEIAPIPLHISTYLCDIESIKLLLSHGASATLSDDFGNSPLDIICRQYTINPTKENMDIIHLLVKNGAVVEGSLLENNISFCVENHAANNHAQLRHQHVLLTHLYTFFLAQNLKSSIMNDDLASVSHLLSSTHQLYHPYVQSFALCAEIRLNPTSYSWIAPMAVHYSSPSMLNVLNELGVDWEFSCRRNQTNLLHIAASNKQGKMLIPIIGFLGNKAVQYLNQRDVQGNTPLMLATQNSDLESIGILGSELIRHPGINADESKGLYFQKCSSPSKVIVPSPNSAFSVVQNGF